MHFWRFADGVLGIVCRLRLEVQCINQAVIDRFDSSPTSHAHSSISNQVWLKFALWKKGYEYFLTASFQFCWISTLGWCDRCGWLSNKLIRPWLLDCTTSGRLACTLHQRNPTSWKTIMEERIRIYFYPFSKKKKNFFFLWLQPLRGRIFSCEVVGDQSSSRGTTAWFECSVSRSPTPTRPSFSSDAAAATEKKKKIFFFFWKR